MIKFVVTSGNAEDGNSDRVVVVKQTIDFDTGKIDCKVVRIVHR